MRVTESAEDADAIRKWLGNGMWKPNTSVMRQGCVVVRIGNLSFDLAPPGYYIVRHPSKKVWVYSSEEFNELFEPSEG